MKGKFLLILIIVLTLAALTNPDASKHRQAVKDEAKKVMLDPDSEKNILSSVIGGFVVDQVVEQLVTVDNYIFFSLTRMQTSTKNEIIGFGLFGYVHVNLQNKEWI